MLWKLCPTIGEAFPTPPLSLYSWCGMLDFRVDYEMVVVSSNIGSHTTRFFLNTASRCKCGVLSYTYTMHVIAK
jgi:hypothetical protein